MPSINSHAFVNSYFLTEVTLGNTASDRDMYSYL